MPLELGPLLESLRGVTWPARRRISGALPGTHHSRLRGAAPELSEYRLYRQGDDPRQLDWKLLARSDRAYVRLAEDRSILATWFVIDASASMAWPIETRAKWERARIMTIALASLAVAAADPVALLVAHHRGAVRIPPRSRRGAVRELTATLASVEPAASPPLAPVLATVKQGSRVVVLSDFLGDEPETRRVAAGLVAGGGEVHAIHLIAREELVPPRKSLRAIDPENHALARSLDNATRDTYEKRFAAWREGIAAAWRLAGASFVPVSTDSDIVRDVRRIVGAAPASLAAG